MEIWRGIPPLVGSSGKNFRSLPLAQRPAIKRQKSAKDHLPSGRWAFSKAVRALMAKEEINPPSPSAVTIMQQKHPPNPSPLTPAPPAPMPPPSQIALTHMQSALLSFEKGASPGPGELRHERVIDLTRAPRLQANRSTSSALIHLTKNMASGQAPPHAARSALA